MSRWFATSAFSFGRTGTLIIIQKLPKIWLNRAKSEAPHGTKKNSDALWKCILGLKDTIDLDQLNNQVYLFLIWPHKGSTF